MRAVKTARSNFVFNPPRGGQGWCDPVWVERTTISIGDGDRLPCLKLAFELDAADLVRLNAGARLELTVVGEGMPPVALAAGVVDGPPAALAIADVNEATSAVDYDKLVTDIGAVILDAFNRAAGHADVT